MVSVALILEDTANTWLQMTNMIFSTTVFSIWLKTKYHFFTFEAFSTTENQPTGLRAAQKQTLLANNILGRL